jgi:hypothetical protein
VSKFSLQRFPNSLGLSFQELLSQSSIEEALAAEKVKYRNRLFNPIVTLWAFLYQVLDTDKSLLLGGQSNYCLAGGGVNKPFLRQIEEDTRKPEKDC